MNELFKIKDLSFFKEDFLDEINEFLDIIPIIQDMAPNLSYDVIECVGENDCCGKTNKNYIVEIQGFLNEDDEFFTIAELGENAATQPNLDLFVIRVYKCIDCGKWIIDILE